MSGSCRVGGSCRGGVDHVEVVWGGLCRVGVHHTGVEWAVKNFTGLFDLSQVRCSVFSSEKLLSTAFWIMWEKTCFFCFFLAVALVESISFPLRTQAAFLLLSVETNVIIMPSRYLYKEHLVIFFI